MKPLALKEKAAYYAKVRARNYMSSLRLEGFGTPSKVAGKSTSTQSSLKKDRRNRA
ncbi:YhfG family protein [Luteibacter sp. 621]|uniref:YhfG family protein n=1 Tax=Luteibacter sp. 621 TaxID=3373916 RepID=UPI003D24A524